MKNDGDFPHSIEGTSSRLSENWERKVMQGNFLALRDVHTRATLHLFPSLFCNLKCPYCSQRDNLLPHQGEDFSLDGDFLAKVAPLSNLHFVISGGEPLLNVQGMKNLIRLAIQNNHILSFNTNLSMPQKVLTEVLAEAPPETFGYFAVSHHLHSGVDDKQLIENVLFLRRLGLYVDVKYLAIPGDFARIEEYLDFWDSKAVASSVSVLMGQWDGRTFPDGYTSDEMRFIIPRTGSLVLALHFLGGLDSRGLPCRAGNDYVSWNISGKREMITCCQGVGSDVDFNSTFFATGVRKQVPCASAACWNAYSLLEPVTRAVDDFYAGLEQDGLRHPTIPELVTVARRIERDTGRSFTSWPPFFERVARELGLGLAVDDFSHAETQEVFALRGEALLSGLEVRSFGGTPILARNGGALAMTTVSDRDSLRIPFFDIPRTKDNRHTLILSFDSVKAASGDFSWRVIVQDSDLKTLSVHVFRYEPEDGESYVTINKIISFYSQNQRIRLIFAPVGTTGTTFVLGESIRISAIC